MQRFGTLSQGRLVERAHGVFVGGRERDVGFPIGSQPGAVGDPERRLAVTPVPDGLAEIQLPREAQDRQHGVVERLRFGVVGAVNTYVVNHEKIVARLRPQS